MFLVFSRVGSSVRNVFYEVGLLCVGSILNCVVFVKGEGGPLYRKFHTAFEFPRD